MFSVFVVVALEMFLTTRGARHSHSHEWDVIPEDEVAQAGEQNGHLAPPPPHTNGKAKRNRPKNIALKDMDVSEGLIAGASPFGALTPDPTQTDLNYDEYENDSDLEFTPDELSAQSQHMEPATPSKVLSPEEEQKRQILQCLLLEAGILFHSIFIGMAVSVATGPPFVVFLIAIAFHQSFEGIALGSRIAAINFPSRSLRPWLMVLAYGTTTPIGQAIGLVVHNMYDPRSATGLLMVGFMNAISSGLLVFAGLVQLLAEDFLSDKSYGVLVGKRRWQAYGAMVAGAMLMALVGAWA